jgi:hypothetical protein
METAGHCLLGALLHLSRKRGLPTAPAVALLLYLGLVQRDDTAGNAGGSAIYAAAQYRWIDESLLQRAAAPYIGQNVRGEFDRAY